MLGALILDERLTVAVAAGAALIVGSVFVAVRQEGARRSAPLTRGPSRPTSPCS